ncbi:Smr/MutS family protein [Tianweitania sp. BSSL-BM11]|uniref:Smr/MutS family protein n=1 Tax=Tianweitania aestuarii TaxID=2814886 RepID=A0ABS5S146_9HYPH|nr:Smr/MutS family protein [Tianweitania aestuarii]MBS9721647.1 Smr/MutS family protein [Tianweitania aestuarii]
MKRPLKPLSDEDRILWHTVASTATPMKGKALPLESLPTRDVDPTDGNQSSAERFAADLDRAPAVKRPAATMTAPRQVIDRPTREKLAKGRVVIDGKIDLHGLTQSEAHSMLLGFLHQAYAHDRRHVLVVTGKGASFGSEGILKRAVPAWFATPAFRTLVGGYHDAARHHGGTGALYVRLRRRTA